MHRPFSSLSLKTSSSVLFQTGQNLGSLLTLLRSTQWKLDKLGSIRECASPGSTLRQNLD